MVNLMLSFSKMEPWIKFKFSFSNSNKVLNSKLPFKFTTLDQNTKYRQGDGMIAIKTENLV